MGVLVFKEEAPISLTNEETLIETRGPKPLAVRMIQRDHESGNYMVTDAARSRTEFKDFLWDDLMVEANMEGKTSTKW